MIKNSENNIRGDNFLIKEDSAPILYLDDESKQILQESITNRVFISKVLRCLLFLKANDQSKLSEKPEVEFSRDVMTFINKQLHKQNGTSFTTFDEANNTN